MFLDGPVQLSSSRSNLRAHAKEFNIDRRPNMDDEKYINDYLKDQDVGEIKEYLEFKSSSASVGSGLGGHCCKCKQRQKLTNGVGSWICEKCEHRNEVDLEWN